MDADENTPVEEGDEQIHETDKVNGSSPVSPERDDYESDTPPTTEEWKKMKGYGSFITHDESNEEYIFHVNDFIYVLPDGKDPEEEIDQTELWLAQIRSIRAWDSDRVWIKAKWFYDPGELPKKVKGANGKSKAFGNFERISSNQADFIPTSTCCGVASIIAFDEQNLEQEEIEPTTFYYRCDYDWQKQTLKRPSPPCSICKKPYNPDTDTMHFCPRPQCRKSWHTPCLEKANWLMKDPQNFLQRIESLDGQYSTSDIPKPSPKKKVRVEKVQPTHMSEDAYTRIPPDLVAVARQPIARGGSLGVVGNVRSVTRARMMLQNALRDGGQIPDDWREKLGTVYNVSAIGPSADMKRKGRVLAYQCPQCGEPI